MKYNFYCIENQVVFRGQRHYSATYLRNNEYIYIFLFPNENSHLCLYIKSLFLQNCLSAQLGIAVLEYCYFSLLFVK